MGKLLGVSWRTSVAGWLALLGAAATALAAYFDNDPATVPDVAAVMDAAVVALVGIGLLAARDNTVSSERAGAA